MSEETLALWRRWTELHGVEVEDLQDLQGWRRDSALRWSLRPGIEIDARNIFVGPEAKEAAHWTLRTNSRGFRTPEFAQAPADGTLRVVTVGDSNTMGWLLDSEDAYPRRLEDHLTQMLGSAVEVVNLGLSGYTSYSCMRILLEEALGLEPDAVVISCGANDAQRLTSSDAAYAEQFAGPLGRLREATGQLRLVAVLRGMLSGGTAERVSRVAPEAFRRNLEAMFRAVKRLEIPVVFLRVCCCPPRYGKQLAAAARRVRVPVINAPQEARAALEQDLAVSRLRESLAEVRGWYTDELLAERPELDFMFMDKCHLNPVGADAVAEALASHLAIALRGS
ncbi:MAG: SGNH/GDSL hydrolase family protein [Deltaproteobacteria bacterium]|nr:SGNH/GDSL hydrolase family protein [Deltaproteobacteria bacterium]